MNFADLPKIDELLRDPRLEAYKEKLPPAALLRIAREAVEQVRSMISGTLKPGDKSKFVAAGFLAGDSVKEGLREKAIELCQMSAGSFLDGRLRRVINATGVIIHTNLGRAPMSRKSIAGLEDMLNGYSNLEYSVKDGKRRSRIHYLEKLVTSLTGAEAAAFVNNNAAALLVVLNTLCEGKDALVSRGEIVEIGGSFRVSEIIKKSGARLAEVGSTNRTGLYDYEDGITPETGAILKIHASNYKMTGYTESVSVKELAGLSKLSHIPLVEDMGSGVLTDLSGFGIKERRVQDALTDGADLVTFSGDKLLGGPQAGIIAGKKDLIDRIKRNQLIRCLRLDKARIYMLENTLAQYYKSKPDIPAFNSAGKDTEAKAKKLLGMLEGNLEGNKDFEFNIVECGAEFGGGALPGEVLKSHGVSVIGHKMSDADIEKALRTNETPIIGVVRGGSVILDVMAIEEEDFEIIRDAFKKLLVHDCN